MGRVEQMAELQRQQDALLRGSAEQFLNPWPDHEPEEGFGDEDKTNPKDRIGVLKPNLHLVPSALEIHAAKAMENGARKYGPFNWREHPVKASVYVSAARRHLLAWFDGQDVAEDSKVHHLGHAAACLAILLDAEATGSLIDDRAKGGPAQALIDALTEETS